MAEATIAYLFFVENVIEAYVHPDKNLQERLYPAIYSVQFLRIWRNWLYENHIPIAEHFITMQVWESLEFIYGITSQINEKFFRKIRSLTGMCFTNLNCTIKSFMHRLHLIEFEEQVVHRLNHLFTPSILQKRNQIFLKESKSNEITADILEKITIKAIFDATSNCRGVGMTCEHIRLSQFLKPVKVEKFPLSEENTLSQSNNIVVNMLDDNHINLDLKIENDEEDVDDDVEIETKFIQKYEKIDNFLFTADVSYNSYLTLKDGSLFAKKTLLWLLANRTYKLSNDVRDRFIPRRILTLNLISNKTETFWKCETVIKGDFIIIRHKQNLLYGLLLTFKRTNQTTLGASAYNFDYCNLANTENIAVTLSPAYKIINYHPVLIDVLFDPVSLKNYVCHSKPYCDFSDEDFKIFYEQN